MTKTIIIDNHMRFYKEVWGIIWEFNSIGEFISFTLGRVLGVIIFFLTSGIFSTFLTF